MGIFAFRTFLLAIVLIVSGFAMAFSVLFVSSYLAACHLETKPVETKIRVDVQGRVTTDQLIYSAGRYGVVEFAHLRLAFRGRTFSEKYRSGMALSTDGLGGGTLTASLGDALYTQRGIQGGVNCNFAGVPFNVVSSKLSIDGEQFSVDGPERLIVIDEAGNVESTVTVVHSKEEP